MERTETAGLGVAVLGHAALLAALTLGLFSATAPSPVQDAIEVSFVDEVALDSASPTPAAEPPPPATAPELGAPEQPPSAPDAASAPNPAPVAPAPAATPVAVQPRQSDSRDRRRPEEPRQTPGQRARANRLADLNLDSLGADRPRRPAAPAAAPGATMTAQAAASIAQAIIRRVQPCADRQVHPGPGAERIVTSLRLRINRDGSLQGRPVVAGQRGIDDENSRYAQRVADLAVNAFVSCAPLRGLPQELYAVPRGWSNFTMNYRLPG